MPKLDLNNEEARMLREILESYLSDLRMEIADTDSMDFREMLKGRKEVLNKAIAALQEAGGALETPQGQILFCFVAHDGDVHFRPPHVCGDLDKSHRHIPYARVAQFGEDGHTDHFTDCFSGFQYASGTHRESIKCVKRLCSDGCASTLGREEKTCGRRRPPAEDVLPLTVLQSVRATSTVL